MPRRRCSPRAAVRCAARCIGNGFFQPPALQPMPSFREWDHIDPQRLAQADARALATCNAVLAAEGQAPLAALHELTAADECFLLTWPELDHYGAGPQGRPGHATGAPCRRGSKGCRRSGPRATVPGCSPT